MGTSIKLWGIDGNELKEIQGSELPSESDLHEWLKNDLSLISDEIMLLGSEVSTGGGFVDLLALDENGDLVVIELKRDKTPREITAQALDYASSLKEFDYQQVLGVAAEFYGGVDKFKDEFKAKFDSELPESLNQEHRIIVVASRLDDSTERVINYLSQEYGVPINAVLFEYFKDYKGQGFLAKTTLIEEETAKARTKTKRGPNLTWEKVDEIVEERKVAALYDRVSEVVRGAFSRHTTRTTVAFDLRLPEGRGRRVIFFVSPYESSAEEGLSIAFYRKRIEKYFDFDVISWAKEFGGKEEIAYSDTTIFVFNIKDRDEIGRLFQPLLKD
ncbi:MAG: endonuclease NucS domain-containing protein [bacterium]